MIKHVTSIALASFLGITLIHASEITLEQSCSKPGFRASVCEVLPNLEIPVLETAHLILRKIEPKDAEDMFEFTSDPRVEDCDPIDTCLQQTHEYINSLITCYQTNKPAPWGIEHKQDKKLIGYCGFFDFDPHNSKGRIGYGLAPKYWNQGLMLEALEAIFAYAFATMKLNRIEAWAHVDNERSLRILEKAGMNYEGTLHEFEFKHGGYQDVKIFAVLKQHYIKTH